MKWEIATSLSLVLALAAPATVARGDIVNRSFETGDFTGWTGMGLGGFVVAGDGGSDGDHYLSATADWTLLPKVPGVGGSGTWHWQVNASQVLDVPAWATAFSVDVRTDGCDQWGVALTQTISMQSVLLLGEVYPTRTPSTLAPNGFMRYTIDISAAAGLEGIVLSICGGGDSAVLPADPVEFSVDNLQFIPEPATLAFLGGSFILLLRRRRR